MTRQFWVTLSAGGSAALLAGAYLFQALGDVPPTVPTDPVITFKKCSVLATAHPPRFPAPALRQLCVAKRVPARPILRAISTIISAFTPLSFSANSGDDARDIAQKSGCGDPDLIFSSVIIVLSNSYGVF